MISAQAWEICRASRFNQRGHEIRYAAEHLLFLIRELKESDKRKLIASLKDVTEPSDERTIDDLLQLLPDATHVGWVLEMFLSELRTILIPAMPKQTQQRQMEHVLEHCGRKSR